MKVYRLASRKYAKDLTGEGARLFGGRWNHKGCPCVYSAESRALAVLEYSVNMELFSIPRTLCMITLEVPEDNIFTPPTPSLPGNWKAAPAPAETKDFGTAILTGAKYGVIRIPSAVIEAEYNYLLNPLHPDMARVKILDVSDFVYDIRIKDNELL